MKKNVFVILVGSLLLLCSIAHAAGSKASKTAILGPFPGQISPVNLLGRLEGYWTLDEQIGIRRDATLNHFDLFPFAAGGNAVAYSSEGIINGAAYFDTGSDIGLFTKSAAARQRLSFVGDWTVSVWVKGMDYHEYTGENVFTKGLPVYLFRNADDNTFTIHFEDGANQTLILDHRLAYVLPPNEWHHLALRLRGLKLEFFVDGSLRETVMLPRPLPKNSYDFGVGMQNIGYPWLGSIDEIGYWARTLNDAEIAALYNNGRGLAFRQFGQIVSAQQLFSGDKNGKWVTLWNFLQRPPFRRFTTVEPSFH